MTTAIITGASGGIGRELARLFARDGYDLALVARNRPTLKGLADELVKRHGIRAWPLVADLGQSPGPVAVAEAVKATGAEVSVLVNNAGFGLHGRFAQTSLERELEMIRVNVAALTHLTKLFLPGMLARRSGRIVNVASTAAFQAGPLMSVYYASKAFVLSFSLALAVELDGTGVTVTTLCPGPTRTGFQVVAGTGDTPLFSGLGVMDAAPVAAAGYRAAMRGDALVIPGILNKLVAQSTRLGSRLMAAKIAGWRQRRRVRSKK